MNPAFFSQRRVRRGRLEREAVRAARRRTWSRPRSRACPRGCRATTSAARSVSHAVEERSAAVGREVRRRAHHDVADGGDRDDPGGDRFRPLFGRCRMRRGGCWLDGGRGVHPLADGRRRPLHEQREDEAHRHDDRSGAHRERQRPHVTPPLPGPCSGRWRDVRALALAVRAGAVVVAVGFVFSLLVEGRSVRPST